MTPDVETRPAPAPPAASSAGSPSDRLVAPVASMLAVVTAVMVMAFLRFREFYLAGDSIAQWLPVSRRIGQLIRNGESHLMDPTMWRGGNFIAEARFGIFNPVVLLVDATILQLDDLAMAALLANLLYMLLLATGMFLLAREYGAAPWPSALAGLVMATGGWTLWMDAAWWTPHLASLAFTPWVWLAARRVARGVGAPAWLVVAGALCVTAGNPYSNVIVLLIVAAVAAEFGRRRTPAPLLALTGSLAAIGLIALFAHVAFQQTSGVGPRETGVFNDGSWTVGFGDLLTSSSPTATPSVRNFGNSVLGFPGFYLAWFVLPLAPWMRWRELARREYTGLAVVAGSVLVLALGPSNFWFFRWPMRLIPYLHLPIVVAVAVVLGHGLLTSRQRRERAVASAGIIVAGAYLAWADVPEDLGWHVGAAALVGAATAIVLFVAGRRGALMVPTLIVATLAVTAFQLEWRPFNTSVRQYDAPTAASTYVERFDGRYGGNVVQIASFDAIPASERRPDGAFADLTVGSTFGLADVESVSGYSGIGFVTHDASLCIRFDGAMCAEAWDRLWRTPNGHDRPLADLVGADTIVVQRTLLDTSTDTPPDGWALTESTPTVDVWTRTAARPWSQGRLTEVTGPVAVDGDRDAEAHREVVTMQRTGDGVGRLTFARLAWPGYEASIDGRALSVGGGPAGLLTVAIPPDVTDGDVIVTWTPPYWRPSLLLLAVGLLIGLATQIVWWRRRSTTDGSLPATSGIATPL